MKTTSSEADDLYIALAHPLRRRILRAMIVDGRETSPRELASNLEQPLSRLSYHVRVLAHCKAIEPTRTRRIRGSTQHFYRAVVEAPWARMALAAHEGSPGDGKR